MDDANVEVGEDGIALSRLLFTGDRVDGFSSSMLEVPLTGAKISVLNCDKICLRALVCLLNCDEKI